MSFSSTILRYTSDKSSFHLALEGDCDAVSDQDTLVLHIW